MRCEHLGDATGQIQTAGGEELQYRCRHPAHGTTTLSACLLCPDCLWAPTKAPKGQVIAGGLEKLVGEVAAVPAGRHPKGMIVNRGGHAVDLGDHWLGATAFAVLGGPSLRELPLELLARRGILIFSTNNCPAALPSHIRPHAWIHTDPTFKFHDSIWRDPGILKFCPVREWGNAAKETRPAADCRKKHAKGLRHRAEDGLLEYWPGVSASSRPGVLGYHRNTSFDPERFLWEPSINRGNDKDSSHGTPQSKPNGWPHCINTMFSVLRLAFYMGVQRLYLLGADFRMTDSAPYAFDQGKHAGGVRSNNSTYADMMAMLDALQPIFLKQDFHVFNCSPASNLWTFPQADFTAAVEEATGDIEQEMDCRGWYDDWKLHREEWDARHGNGSAPSRVAEPVGAT